MRFIKWLLTYLNCPLGFFCAWPINVEFAAWLSARTRHRQRNLRTIPYWCIRHIGGSMKICCMNLLGHCYYHRCSLVVQSGVAQHLTTSVTYLSASKWATIVKCGPRWTNSTPDKISVLLICTNGELLRWIRAHVFSRRWITTMHVTPTDQTCSWLPSSTISCWWWCYHLAKRCRGSESTRKRTIMSHLTSKMLFCRKYFHSIECTGSDKQTHNKNTKNSINLAQQTAVQP